MQLFRLLKGCECYECSRQSVLQRRYKENLKERQENLYNRAIQICSEKNYTLLTPKENIERNITYVEYKCPNPNHPPQKMRIANLLCGKECPLCGRESIASKNKMNIEEVKERIKECKGELLNEEEYKNSRERNLFISCPECKKPFKTSFVLFTQHGGQVCPECSNVESVGEKRIRLFLEEHNISFIPQKWFPDCKAIKPLPFDFYLPEKNLIIEFDGRQHFKETSYFHYTLEETQEHDRIKNEYCKSNNISLLKIPYTKINKIETLLTEELFSHKDIV